MGTCIGIGGEGFCILAGDTRMSLGYDIVSRNTSRVLFISINMIILDEFLDIDNSFGNQWNVCRLYSLNQDDGCLIENV